MEPGGGWVQPLLFVPGQVADRDTQRRRQREQGPARIHGPESGFIHRDHRSTDPDPVGEYLLGDAPPRANLAYPLTDEDIRVVGHAIHLRFPYRVPTPYLHCSLQEQLPLPSAES